MRYAQMKPGAQVRFQGQAWTIEHCWMMSAGNRVLLTRPRIKNGVVRNSKLTVPADTLQKRGKVLR